MRAAKYCEIMIENLPSVCVGFKMLLAKGENYEIIRKKPKETPKLFRNLKKITFAESIMCTRKEEDWEKTPREKSEKMCFCITK